VTALAVSGEKHNRQIVREVKGSSQPVSYNGSSIDVATDSIVPRTDPSVR
jgi:hypothetical protein